jgi:putative transposase
MTQMTEMIDPVTGEIIDEHQIAEQLLAQAKEQGVSLIGPGGLLGGLTKTVLETALEAEMTEHLGYEKHQVTDSENARNGTRSKTVLTEIGAVEIEVPRDRDGSFEPKIVKKRQRRLDGIDEIVLSLTARGLTTGEVAAHFGEVYGADVSKDTISKITDKVIAEMTEWQNRPLDRVYPVVFIDAIVVKSVTGRCATSRSLSRSASLPPGNETSSASGPATAGRARSSGWVCSPRSRTAVSKTCASWCVTD